VRKGILTLWNVLGNNSFCVPRKDPGYARKDKILTNVRKHRHDNVALFKHLTNKQNKVSCVMQVIKNFPQMQCTLLVDLYNARKII